MPKVLASTNKYTQAGWHMPSSLGQEVRHIYSSPITEDGVSR